MNEGDPMSKVDSDENGSSADEEIVASDFAVSPLLTEKPLLVGPKLKKSSKRGGKTAAAVGTSGFPRLRGHVAGTSASYPVTKNCRRPRKIYGRGLPKKGGGGGKGTWGKPGSELAVIGSEVRDARRDPNYDFENWETISFEAITPELTDEEMEKNLNSIFKEYFENGDSNEVIISIAEFQINDKKPLIVVYLISLALGRKPSHREMASVLLSDLYGKHIYAADMVVGLLSLLEKLSDLVLDTPDAAFALGNFIARAIADDALAPMFVQEYRYAFDCPHARECLEHADNLLRMTHGLVRLDNVWGVGGGMRPVKYLVKQIKLILKEYIVSGEMEEAIRCLQELEVPHFHHEFVYESVYIVIEDTREKTMELICKLLKAMWDAGVVLNDQLKAGFERIFLAMPDLCIDVPNAYTVLKQFVAMCDTYGFLASELIRQLPTRGRKRFFSEGDGGLIKD